MIGTEGGAEKLHAKAQSRKEDFLSKRCSAAKNFDELIKK